MDRGPGRSDSKAVLPTRHKLALCRGSQAEANGVPEGP